MVISLLCRLGTMQIQDPCQESNTLPTVIAGLDTPTLQTTLKMKQRHNNSNESLLQACISEAASRGEGMQGFQLFPVMEQRDAQVKCLEYILLYHLNYSKN